ncbi:hypothetical protein [Actinoplanes sp. NPDC049265]|uniref:hypothetical protein n=1 Tax=Actinoplanes sp. NPDC049265 TaxID=3363902 RepID=UPI00371D2837
MTRRPHRKILRAFVNFTALTVGISAGIAQLANLSDGLGQWLLTAVGIGCLLFLVVRFSLHYYVRRAGQLEDEAERANRRAVTVELGHRRYADAVDRIIDQEGLIYTESLHLIITIGVDDAGDAVEEQRQTTPLPRVTQRAIRPIVPDGSGALIRLEDISFRATLHPSITGNITSLPLPSHRGPRVWLVFDPGRRNPFDWKVTYQPAGLWRPLRQDGFDHLVWTDRLPADNGGRSGLSDLRVEFRFPYVDGPPPHVEELRSVGEFQPARRTERDDGSAEHWVVEWRDPRPAGRRYEWRLAQAPNRTGTDPAALAHPRLPEQGRRSWSRVLRGW